VDRKQAVISVVTRYRC